MSYNATRPTWLRGEFPIIGMVHLAPLPGSPRWGGSMSAVLDRARQDASALADEGVRTILIENYGDAPFCPDCVSRETIAAMAAVLSLLRAEMDPSLSWGVNVLRNDAAGAIAVAAATGAEFIRVNVHAGSAWTDQGLVHGRAWETLRLRSALVPGLAILADVRVKHSHPAAPVPIAESVRDLVERGLADALLVTGERTGSPPDMNALDAVVKAADGIPVLAASGMTEDRIREYLARCCGAIAGTSLKAGGAVGAPVERARVRRMLDSARPAVSAGGSERASQ